LLHALTRYVHKCTHAQIIKLAYVYAVHQHTCTYTYMHAAHTCAHTHTASTHAQHAHIAMCILDNVHARTHIQTNIHGLCCKQLQARTDSLSMHVRPVHLRRKVEFWTVITVPTVITPYSTVQITVGQNYGFRPYKTVPPYSTL